jgi:hypothetical protein
MLAKHNWCREKVKKWMTVLFCKLGKKKKGVPSS